MLGALIERAIPPHHMLKRSPHFGWHLYEWLPEKADYALRYSSRSAVDLFGRLSAGQRFEIDLTHAAREDQEATRGAV